MTMTTRKKRERIRDEWSMRRESKSMREQDESSGCCIADKRSVVVIFTRLTVSSLTWTGCYPGYT